MKDKFILFICIGPNLEAGQIHFSHMYWSKFGSRARPFYSYGLVQIQCRENSFYRFINVFYDVLGEEDHFVLV
jgi:hypothetical protein